MEKPRPTNSTNFISGGLAGALGMHPKGRDNRHLERMLHQERRVKSEDLFLRNIHFREIAYHFRKTFISFA